MPRFAMAAVLAWQTALVVSLGAPADPVHLRYQRAIVLPPGNGASSVCAVLDAAVLAHTASAAHSDLRVYRAYPDSVGPAGSPGAPTEAEVPYLLTESGPEPVDAVQARVENLSSSGRELRFDLRMPSRAYSEVQLAIKARNFVGTAIVSAANGPDKASPVGNFAIFDLQNEGLGRWTTLPLAEMTAARLHVTLSLRDPAGQPMEVSPALVAGAAVPPSRERQTAYTPVATTETFRQDGEALVATLHVPAHVPVEELRVTLQPGPVPNFAREVTVSARPADDPFYDPETLEAGVIEGVRMPSGDDRLNPIHVQETSLPATLGATLASAATVQVSLRNPLQGGAKTPLPLASVMLEMRERRLCFHTVPGAAYTLRYGDAALAAPLYTDPPEVSAATPDARLGPPQRNPHWSPRRDTRPFFDRHPGLFWVLVLLCAGMMGGTALQFVQYRQEGMHG